MVLCSRRGPMDTMNSHRLRCLQASATSSRLALSRIHSPMAVIPTWWIGCKTREYWAGLTSLPVSTQPAMPFSWNRGDSRLAAVEPQRSTGPSTRGDEAAPFLPRRISPSCDLEPHSPRQPNIFEHYSLLPVPASHTPTRGSQPAHGRVQITRSWRPLPSRNSGRPCWWNSQVGRLPL